MKKISLKIDKIALVPATLCLIHCTVLPVLIMFAPLIGGNFQINHMESLEYIFFMMSWIFGIIGICMGHKTHKNIMVPVIIGAGLVGLSVVKINLFLNHALNDTFLDTIPVVLLIVGHIINNRLCKKCPVCKDH